MASRSDEDPQTTRVSGARVRQIRPGSGPHAPQAVRLADDNDDEDEEDIPHSPSANQPLPEEERTFGRYTLLRRLAYGGMGEVFLARQGGQGSLSDVAKLVVIKRILSHTRRDEKHRRMFLDEARLQALLNNPYIVHVHDMGEEAGHVYLAMEHVHGPSWRGVIDRMLQLREQIPVAYVCEMVAQAARGMSYAHNLVDVTGAAIKIVHRDINPHNVLVSYDGEVKVIDFGIAKSELGSGQTETGTIKGKFQYMSPEQSAAEKLDKRSDIFTLGICLYELLTLENPFRRANVVLSLEAIQKETPPPVGGRRRDARPLDRIVAHCLAKHRADRFSDAADLADELDAVRESGMLPQTEAPLSVWLRERFSTEIAEHLQILEATGSMSAAVVSGRSNPGALPRHRGSSSGPRPRGLESVLAGDQEPTRINAVDEPSLELQIEGPRTDPSANRNDASDNESTPVHARTPSREVSASSEERPVVVGEPLSTGSGRLPLRRDVQPTVSMMAPGPLPEDLTSTTPAPARLAEVTHPAAALIVDEQPAQRSAARVWLLLVLLAVTGAAAVQWQRPDAGQRLLAAVGAFGIEERNLTAEPDQAPAPLPITLPITLPTPPDSTIDTTGPSPPDVPVEKAPPLIPGAEVQNKPPERNSQRDPRRRNTPPAREVVKDVPPVDESKGAAATLLVTTEGYLVRGNKKLAPGGSTTVKIEGAPFAVTLKIVDGDDVKVSVSSEPWAILTVDNVGKGKTPISFVLPRDKRVQLTLKNPVVKGAMPVGLQLASP